MPVYNVAYKVLRQAFGDNRPLFRVLELPPAAKPEAVSA